MTDVRAGSRGRRPYRSAVREERARETRRRLADAAATHFLEAGYASTSLVAIAVTAGVCVDTVYKTFGSKIGLLKEVLDVTIGGDDAPGAAARASRAAGAARGD